MDVFLPTNLEEALEIKSARPECVPIAGGTDLMIELNFGRRKPISMMDVSRIPDLLEWRVDATHLFVGAGVTYSRVISEMPPTPPLAAASRTIGSPPIRNCGTIGGNLGTASPAGDALPVLASFEAEVVVSGTHREERVVAWDDFLTGPKRNSLEPNELILGVRWKRVRGPGVFSKIGSRTAMVIAVASLCLVLDEDERATRVAVGSVAPTVMRARQAELLLDDVLSSAGIWGDPEARVDQAGVDEAARTLEASISPIDDVRGTAAYRRHACGVLLGRALAWALEERTLTARRQTC